MYFFGFDMKLISLFAVMTSFTLAGVLSARAQKTDSPYLAEVETKWPGIIFSIPRLERIQDNRLLVIVHVIATSKAAASGTFLGTRPVIPHGTAREELESSRYDGKPFSLASAVMTDEQTLKQYFVLPPVAPPGQRYFPGELANGLRRGQAETLTVQFAAPPAQLVKGLKPAKQSVSILLPGAKGAMANVPVPPLEAKE